MKITGWSIHPYALPYTREIVWANAIERQGTFVLLKLEDASGASGVAECTIKSTWSGQSVRSLIATLEDFLLPAIKGKEIASPAAARTLLAGIPENRAGKTLIDTALWTLSAALAKRPLWSLFAESSGRPSVREASVPLTWAVTRQKPAVMAREAADVFSRYGFGTLKVKGGQGLDVDVQALTEIRAAVGPKVEVYVDANSAYPFAEAASYTRRIAEMGVTVSEDPAPLAADEAFRTMQAACPIPVLVDRMCTSADDATRFIAHGARALSTKPGRIGLSEARKIADLARPHGVKVALGLFAESALGTLVNAQYALAVPEDQDLVAPEQTFFLEMTDQILREPAVIRDGRLVLRDDPDIADWIDWDRVARFAIV